MILFFDTETNGELISRFRTMTETEFFPRVISLAWLLTDLDGGEVSRGNYLIKPDGWEIPREKFWIKNNFSTETSQAAGVPLPGVIDKFLQDYDYCSVMVAHNMDFDYNVLGAELIRYGKRSQTAPAPRKKICTMKEGVMVCKIQRQGGMGWKFPTLSRLYMHLFNKKMKNAHDALGDVLALRDCFFELLKRGIIKL